MGFDLLTYTQAEVSSILNAPDAPLINGIPAKEVEQTLAARREHHARLIRSKEVAERLLGLEQVETIERYDQLQHVTTGVDVLERNGDLEKERRRQETVGHISQTLNDASDRCEETQEEVARVSYLRSDTKGYKHKAVDQMVRKAERVGIDETDPDAIVQAVDTLLFRLAEEQGMQSTF